MRLKLPRDAKKMLYVQNFKTGCIRDSCMVYKLRRHNRMYGSTGIQIRDFPAERRVWKFSPVPMDIDVSNLLFRILGSLEIYVKCWIRLMIAFL